MFSMFYFSGATLQTRLCTPSLNQTGQSIALCFGIPRQTRLVGTSLMPVFCFRCQLRTRYCCYSAQCIVKNFHGGGVNVLNRFNMLNQFILHPLPIMEVYIGFCDQQNFAWESMSCMNLSCFCFNLCFFPVTALHQVCEKPSEHQCCWG